MESNFKLNSNQVVGAVGMDFGHTRTTKTNPLAADCERVAVVWTWMSLQSGSRSLILRVAVVSCVSTPSRPIVSNEWTSVTRRCCWSTATERVAVVWRVVCPPAVERHRFLSTTPSPTLFSHGTSGGSCMQASPEGLRSFQPRRLDTRRRA